MCAPQFSESSECFEGNIVRAKYRMTGLEVMKNMRGMNSKIPGAEFQKKKKKSLAEN
jgi:hypothetical protein